VAHLQRSAVRHVTGWTCGRLPRKVGSQFQLFIRSLDALEPRVLADGGLVRALRAPFFSPDGQWVGFFGGSELRKIRVSGGPVVTICKVEAEVILGASWGDDDSIVFAIAARSGRRGLMIVSASGGEPRVLTAAEPDRGEAGHLYPYVLPQSRGVMFHVQAPGRPTFEGKLVVLDTASGERREIAAAGVAGEYVPGHVVYADPQGALQMQRFDLARLTPTGQPTALGERVHVPALGQPLFSAAATGALAYVSPFQGSDREVVRSLTWVDRQGREEGMTAPPRAYEVARLSPDGTRIALDIRDQENDIWIWSIDRGALTRLTSGPTLDMAPIWTPDSRRIVWSSTREVPNPTLYWQAADGTGAPERLEFEELSGFPGSVTPDGQDLLYFAAPNLIKRLRLTGDHRVELVMRGSSFMITPEVSPDGRWIAYQSDESGAPEIYVRPYPNIDSGRVQISSERGTRPMWNRNGRELFFLDAQGRLSVAPITVSGGTLWPGAVRRVLDTAYHAGFTTRGFNLRGYDVSPDGQRFLMIKNTDEASGKGAVITMVLNWLRVP
jgi:serine/threonine-protein kinase